MHHYPFHLGDYLKSTAHLSAMEDLAYRRLLDMYYDTEAPIPNETQWVARRLRMDSELIANVLREFFEPSEHGWKHARCEAEIAKYRKRCEANKSNGNKGGRKRKPKQNPMGSESDANGFQTKNQEPVCKPPISPKGDSVEFARFWETWPSSDRKVGKAKCAEKWHKSGLDGIADQIVAHVAAMKGSEQWNRGYEPSPLTYLNQRRWEDGNAPAEKRDWI